MDARTTDAVDFADVDVLAHLFFASGERTEVRLAGTGVAAFGRFATPGGATVPFVPSGFALRRPPPAGKRVRLQYGSLAWQYEFDATVLGVSPEGHWLLDLPPAVARDDRRTSPREVLGGRDEAWVMVGFDEVRVVDISEGGFAFEVDDGAPAWSEGMLLDAALRVGAEDAWPVEIEVRNVAVLPGTPGRRRVGVALTAIEEAHRHELRSWLARPGCERSVA